MSCLGDHRGGRRRYRKRKSRRRLDARSMRQKRTMQTALQSNARYVCRSLKPARRCASCLVRTSTTSSASIRGSSRARRARSAGFSSVRSAARRFRTRNLKQTRRSLQKTRISTTRARPAARMTKGIKTWTTRTTRTTWNGRTRLHKDPPSGSRERKLVRAKTQTVVHARSDSRELWAGLPALRTCRRCTPCAHQPRDQFTFRD
mmetsp:Transcript_231/g.603  ORF Transcript_231/g.603 Transcript_231/m.603 type:complete len:204 (-) Transcript_231:47-658(-)